MVSIGWVKRYLAISLWFQSSNPLSINLSKQFAYSFAFDAPTIWNALPDEIRASPPHPLSESSSTLSCIPRHTQVEIGEIKHCKSPIRIIIYRYIHMKFQRHFWQLKMAGKAEAKCCTSCKTQIHTSTYGLCYSRHN